MVDDKISTGAVKNKRLISVGGNGNILHLFRKKKKKKKSDQVIPLVDQYTHGRGITDDEVEFSDGCQFE